MAVCFRAWDMKSGGPWFKSSTLMLSGFVLGHPEFNSLTLVFKAAYQNDHFHRSDATPEAYFQCSIVFTLIGAWLGAFPIPLDWDRPWQVRQGGDWIHSHPHHMFSSS